MERGYESETIEIAVAVEAGSASIGFQLFNVPSVFWGKSIFQDPL